MVRKRGFEPLRCCHRQPLKLVRLPVPPLPRKKEEASALTAVCRSDYSGVSGAVSEGASTGTSGPSKPLMTEPGPRWPMIARTIAPTINRVPRTVVARVSTVAPARAPKAAWLLPLPPNAEAISPPFPCCSKTTTSSRRQMTIYRPDNTMLSISQDYNAELAIFSTIWTKLFGSRLAPPTSTPSTSG